MKKVFAAMIAAMLVLALVPMTAMAATVVMDEASLVNALAAGGEVQLGADITLSDGATLTVDAGKVVTLDLAGYTLSGTKSTTATKNHELILNKGSLTIKDSKENGKISYQYTGAETFSDGNGYATNAVTGDAGSTTTVESGTIENLTTSNRISYAIDVRTNGSAGDTSLTVNDGTITSKKTAIRGFANSSSQKVTIDIQNGVIEGGSGFGVQMQDTNTGKNLGEIRITDGEIRSKSSYGLYLYGNGDASGMKVSVSGGEISSDSSAAMYLTSVGTTASYDAEITGGAFTGDVWTNEWDASSNQTDVACISGGTFSEEPYAGYVDPDALVINTGSGETPFAIGTAAEEALATAPAGSTVEILAAPEGEELTVAPGVTVTNTTNGPIEVNGVTVPGEESYETPGASGGAEPIPDPGEAEPIPETGDGMGLFVAAGLALISMLGMVVLKKREQF